MDKRLYCGTSRSHELFEESLVLTAGQTDDRDTLGRRVLLGCRHGDVLAPPPVIL